MRIRHLLPAGMTLLVLTPALATEAAPDHTVVVALQAKLNSFTADTPLAGTLTIHASYTNSGGDDAGTKHGQITVVLRSDHRGFELRVPTASFDRARAEDLASITDPNANTTSAGILNDFDLKAAQSMLDVAPSLRNALATGQLTAQADVTRNGQTARLLQFDLPSPARVRQNHDIKDYSRTLKLWLDADYTPVAMASQTHIKVRKFLFSFTSDTRRRCELAVIGTHLICDQRHAQHTAGGLGRSFKRATVSTLTDIKAGQTAKTAQAQ